MLVDEGTVIRQSLWVNVRRVTGTGAVESSVAPTGAQPAALLADNQTDTAEFSFRIPTSFKKLVKARVVIISGGTGNMDRQFSANGGGDGQNAAARADSVSSALLAVTTPLVKEDDVSGTLDTMLAGDTVALVYQRNGAAAGDTVGADVFVVGFYMEFLAALEQSQPL